MNTASAFARAQASQNDPTMVFDWDRAAALIRQSKASCASAGLACDWEWTTGGILEGGEPIPQDNTYVFLASTWATPGLMIDSDVVECWRWQSDSPDWNADTYWPSSALAILVGASRIPDPASA